MLLSAFKKFDINGDGTISEDGDCNMTGMGMALPNGLPGGRKRCPNTATLHTIGPLTRAPQCRSRMSEGQGCQSVWHGRTEEEIVPVLTEQKDSRMTLNEHLDNCALKNLGSNTWGFTCPNNPQQSNACRCPSKTKIHSVRFPAINCTWMNRLAWTFVASSCSVNLRSPPVHIPDARARASP